MHHAAAPYTGRRESVLRLCPTLFEAKRILYIGAKHDRFDFADEMREGKCSVYVLEAFLPNVTYLRTLPWLKGVIHGDVRDISPGAEIFGNTAFDVVLWWHGPEHIEGELLGSVLQRLEAIAKEWVVLGCPWGLYEQGSVGGNPWERHISHHYPETYEALGYSVECLGETDVKGSNITSVKRRCETSEAADERR